MDTVTLGRTGLRVGVAGLGCGGHSRLGISQGKGEANAVRIVEEAIGLGVTLIDTAIAYRTEEVVGRAIRGKRDRVVLSTKLPVQADAAGEPARAGRPVRADEARRWLEGSLRRLGTDHVDILFLHSPVPDEYAETMEELYPVMKAFQEAGYARFLALSEMFSVDTTHEMFKHALPENLFDVVMFGYNVFNQTATRELLPACREANLGTLNIFAVRRAISRPAAATELVDALIAAGEVEAGAVDRERPLDFLMREGGARTAVEGAYRFCRHTPGVDVVLTGTGDAAHLRENIAAINAPPLAAAALARATALFGRATSGSGE